MKKIVLIGLIVISVFLMLFIALAGVRIGNFELPSIQQLADKNYQIDSKIAETNKLTNDYYLGKDSELNSESRKLVEAKEEFAKLTENTSSKEIANAMTEKTYQIDFLYTQLGTHATDAGVYTEFTEVEGDIEGVTDINFVVEGTYVGITNFIEAIEKDSKLNYTIKNFKIVNKEEDGSVQRATFTVKNVKITY